jgi:C4-dicarboxylate-specific signal transduction histidine kinase
MKNIIISVLLIAFFSDAQATKVDSIYIKNKLENIESLIEQGNRKSLNRGDVERIVDNRVDSILRALVIYHSNEMQQFNQQSTQIDSIQDFSFSVQMQNAEFEKRDVSRDVIQIVVQSISFLLIVLLILYILSLRRDTLTYLISQAREIEEQGSEILDKANELKVSNEQLKKLISAKKRSKLEEKKKIKEEKKKQRKAKSKKKK